MSKFDFTCTLQPPSHPSTPVWQCVVNTPKAGVPGVIQAAVGQLAVP